MGVIVTAPGRDADFVSRFFAPKVGIPEDPVTGSAHCTLIPYWSRRMGRSRLHARQVSARGGELWCALEGDRVSLAGEAALYLEGVIRV
jgi:predicted PhzF superfamily epimerase YddE/YHI9